MKRFFTLSICSLIVVAAQAQFNHMSELQVGVNIPTLEYANNYTINAQTGFAKTGLYTSASYSPTFGRLIVPKAQLFYGFNPFDETAFYNAVVKQYEATPDIKVSNFNAFSYSYIGAAIGPGFKTRGEKFFVRFNVMFSFVHQSHPELRTEGKDLSDMKDWSDVLVQTSHNSFGGILELSFYKSLGERFFLTFNSSVFGSPFNFNQDGTYKKDGEVNNHYQNPRQGEIDNVNLSFGLSYLLNKPKARIVIF